MVLFFYINNYKIILDINNFYENLNINFVFGDIELEYYILSLIDFLLFLSFIKTGINIINFDFNNYTNNILYYSILSLYQFIKPIIIFYIYYNYYNTKLNISIMFNIFSVILNIISIKLIIRYKKIFITNKYANVS